MSTYSIREMFYTLQGEGAQAGRAAVFCRFAGCNLWTGREQDRASAICQFCDTEFVGTGGVGGGKFASAESLALAVKNTWQGQGGRPYVVLTGGEPMLQVDAPLLQALHAQGFEVAIETNGTLPVPNDVDWICVSPKQGSTLIQTHGDELKVVVPQVGQQLDVLAQLNFKHFFVQPMDVQNAELKAQYVQQAVAYCQSHPTWRLSIQTHKMIGIP